MRHALLVAMVLVPFEPTWAQSHPDFAAYPSHPIYAARSAVPDLSKPYARLYRTSIRRAAKEPTNFAGDYSLVFVGCGSDECIRGVILDRISGKVRPVPFGFCGAKELYDRADVANFRPDSHLVVFTGLYQCGLSRGTYFYDFDGRRFRRLSKQPLPKPPEDVDHPG